MVGVAGKSQSCNTCRQRRLKAKRACEGYDRNRIFVNRTLSSPSTTATSVLSGLRAQQQPTDILANPNVEAGLRSLFSESSNNNHEFRKYAVKLLEATYLPKQPVSSEENFSWAYRLVDLTGPSKSLDTSLFAFCITQLHFTGTSKASLYQCLDQYNTALQHLNSDLDDPQRRFQEETLAAILVLTTCELFVCPVENGWSVHARGIAEILRLRNPGMASTPAWRHLFARMRVVCTLEALTKRQAQILENDMWRQTATEFGVNGALDEVLQMIADIPAIFERADKLPSISDRSALLNESAAVVRSILAMVNSLESWHGEFWKASPTARAWLVPSCAANPADGDPFDKTFPLCFEFESLSVATPILMCWAVNAHLYSNVIQIYDLIQARLGRRVGLEYLLAQADSTMVEAASQLEESRGNTPMSTAHKGCSIQEIHNEGSRMARYVCQSLEYFHRIDMGTYGGHATTYQSWSARQYFRLHPGREREWLWLLNIHKMDGPGTRWGLAMKTFADIVEPLGAPKR
ncbi:hypothetical protein BJ170DRAFT_596283 [Xylariales sp. AK1849]|nr:hypothetical protein BJ170DRAFT_596283 [Xylariales sp. AK1849]